MRKLILVMIMLLALMIIPLALAQEAPVYELPALADGDIIEDSFESNVTTRLYAFHASADDTVRISMEQVTPDLDPLLVLLDSDGAVLAYDDDSGDVALSALIEDVTLEEDGIYFVLATSFNFVDGIETETEDELQYTLTVSGQTTPEDVEDPEIATLEVTPILLGDSVEGESTEDAPAAIFFFEGEDGDSVVISLEDADFFSVLHVFDPEGSRIAVDPSLVELELEDEGVYLIMATDLQFYEAIDDNSAFEGGIFILVIQ